MPNEPVSKQDARATGSRDSWMEKPERIWTVGHSTRSLEDFISLLKQNSIRVIADVRQFPASRRYPHFGQGPLAKSLAEENIGYVHFPELGGRRRAKPDSLNTAWRNEAFRGYADYLATEEFRAGMERLTETAKQKRTAVMCAEAVWWRCHRGLISDFLKAEGWEVRHILAAKKTEEHPFTSAARIVDGKLSYRATESEAEFSFATETKSRRRLKRQ